MTQQRLYQPPNPGLETLLETLRVFPDVTGWLEEIRESGRDFERICVDRYLLILNGLRSLSLYDCSLLDLGCSSGFFAYSFAVTMASQVTAVDDGRALAAGYGDAASTRTLRDDCAKNGMSHVEIVEQSVQKFLSAQAAADRRWDAVLCLNVLHHFFTGYGDDPQAGRLSVDELRALYGHLGNVTRAVMYLEVDRSRIDSVERLVSEICEFGGFEEPRVIGWSCSAVAEPRPLWEFKKRDG